MVERNESTENTVKFAIKNHETFELEQNNNEKLLRALEHSREKIISKIIIAVLNHKKELADQITQALQRLNDEKKSLEDELKQIQEQEVLQLDPNVYEAFQERKHEHDLKILTKKKTIIEKKIARVSELIKDFGEPDEFIKTLIKNPVIEKENNLIYDCLESLAFNNVSGGLELMSRNPEEGVVEFNLDNIETLIKISTDAKLTNEIYDLSKKVKEVKTQYSVAGKEKELEEQEKKHKIAMTAEAVADEYIENLLTLFKSKDELIELEEERDLVGKPSFLKRFMKGNNEKNYDIEIEKQKEKIANYENICAGKKSGTFNTYSSLRKYWKEYILKRGYDSKEKSDLDIIKQYIEDQDNEKDAVKKLVNSAESFFSKKQDEFNERILQLYDEIDLRQEECDREIGKLINSSSTEIQEAIGKGVDLNKAKDFHRLRSDFSTGEDEYIVPAVALLVLYELLKDENIESIEQGRKMGYEIPSVDELRKQVTEKNREVVSKLADIERKLTSIQQDKGEELDNDNQSQQEIQSDSEQNGER